MEGLILAAGRGSRLSRDNNACFSKALVKVKGVPLIVYALENLCQLNIEKATIVIGAHHHSIISTLGNTYKNIKLRYVLQEEPIGLVNAILCAADQIQAGFFLQLSDEIFLDPQMELAVSEFRKGLDFVVGYTIDSAERIKCNYSIETDEDMLISHCVEKPVIVNNNLKGTGVCVFSKPSIDLLHRVYDRQKNEPNDLCDFINLLIANGKKGRAVEIAKEEINVNTLEELFYAERRLEYLQGLQGTE